MTTDPMILSVCWLNNSKRLSPPVYQAPVMKASRCGNERQERSDRWKVCRRGSVKTWSYDSQRNHSLFVQFYFWNEWPNPHTWPPLIIELHQLSLANEPTNQPTYVYVYVCLFENKSDWQKMGELPKTELHKKFFETEPRIRSSFKEEILIYLN